MAFRDAWVRRANVETRAISGSLRVEIRLRQTIQSVTLELAGYAFLLWVTTHRWSRMVPPQKTHRQLDSLVRHRSTAVPLQRIRGD